MESLKETINSLPTVKSILEAEVVINHLAGMYERKHGVTRGAAIIESEKHAFFRIIDSNSSLQKCSKISLYGCFIDALVQGLSFSGNQVYIIPYGTTAKLSVSPYGELTLRVNYGQLLCADPVRVVFDCDTCEVQGGEVIHHMEKHPRPNDARIVLGYVWLTRPNGHKFCFTLPLTDIVRIRSYAKGNALYGKKADCSDIDLGFFKAKVLKHAFKTLPNVRPVGKFTQIEEEEQIDYGIEIEEVSHASHSSDYLAQEATIQQDQDASGKEQDSANMDQAMQPTSKEQAQDLNVPF